MKRKFWNIHYKVEKPNWSMIFDVYRKINIYYNIILIYLHFEFANFLVGLYIEIERKQKEGRKWKWMNEQISADNLSAAIRYIDTMRISISEREREGKSWCEWGRKGISCSCIESLSIRWNVSQKLKLAISKLQRVGQLWNGQTFGLSESFPALETLADNATEFRILSCHPLQSICRNCRNWKRIPTDSGAWMQLRINSWLPPNPRQLRQWKIEVRHL